MCSPIIELATALSEQLPYSATSEHGRSLSYLTVPFCIAASTHKLGEGGVVITTAWLLFGNFNFKISDPVARSQIYMKESVLNRYMIYMPSIA